MEVLDFLYNLLWILGMILEEVMECDFEFFGVFGRLGRSDIWIGMIF